MIPSSACPSRQTDRSGPNRTSSLPTTSYTTPWGTILRHDRIAAPCLLDGPINGTSFLAWIQQFLLPTLNSGDIVVMDNLGSHKAIAVRQALRAVGAKLFFLPPYSPDLNPIEQVFAKLKTLLRKAEPRTVDATSDTLNHILQRFSPTECAAYIRNAGYASM